MKNFNLLTEVFFIHYLILVILRFHDERQEKLIGK